MQPQTTFLYATPVSSGLVTVSVLLATVWQSHTNAMVGLNAHPGLVNGATYSPFFETLPPPEINLK
jgi:hypothetical protein